MFYSLITHSLTYLIRLSVIGLHFFTVLSQLHTATHVVYCIHVYVYTCSVCVTVQQLLCKLMSSPLCAIVRGILLPGARSISSGSESWYLYTLSCSIYPWDWFLQHKHHHGNMLSDPFQRGIGGAYWVLMKPPFSRTIVNHNSASTCTYM